MFRTNLLLRGPSWAKIANYTIRRSVGRQAGQMFSGRQNFSALKQDRIMMYNPNPIKRQTLITRKSFHNMAQAAIVPILPTILFSIPLSIPYFLTLKVVASRILSPPTRTKITKYIGSALMTIPLMFMFSFNIAPNTQRYRFMILWSWEEKKLLNAANECVENVLGSESIVPDEDPRSQMVEHVINRLWRQGLKKNEETPPPKVYLILNDETLDGLSYPSSVITLTTCWFRIIGHDQDLLAALMAHELAHIVQSHASEFYGISFMTKALTKLTSILGNLTFVVNKESKPSIFLQKHSQKLEREADLLGQEIMARAGYDPAKAVELWELMSFIKNSPDLLEKNDYEEKVVTFRSHPSEENRVKYLRENLTRFI
ncbi:2709_t:CDS:1 [Acaulospora morrowiae]|uniref:2709_t:CDS:1 n=1 Tax=Acaulospora morrowiae TaxID=94023 RepID=A0A9N9ERT8_9GLOM|nr:2709_t:CDS:1 [Acaulospora morrowiae]